MIRVSRKDLRPVVVAIDPAVTSGEDSDETGIIVVGRGPHQPDTCKLTTFCPGHGYVLADVTCRDVPSGWAKKAIAAFDRWTANRIVAEVNNGGDMVGSTIQAVRVVPYEAVRATKGKLTRAEPASALYEQGRVHHLGSFPELEDQLTNWTPTQGTSPDRLDALVWGLTALALITPPGGPIILDDDELDVLVAANARLNGDADAPPAPVRPGQQFGGDWRLDPTDDEDPDDTRGKVARSPFV